MKNLLSIICVLTVYASGAQDTKIFNQGGNLTGYLSEVIDHNGTPFFVSMKDTSNGFVTITTGELTADLETKNYKHIQYELPNDMTFSIGGAGIKNNILLISFITSNPSNNQEIQQFFIRVNLNTGTVVNSYTEPQFYRRTLLRSKQHGDSLITYAVDMNGDVYRTSFGILNGTASESTVIQNVLIGGTSTQINDRLIALEFRYNDEFAIISNYGSKDYIIKRDGAGSYVHKEFQFGTHGQWPSYVALSNGDFYLIKRNNAIRINNNLDSLSFVLFEQLTPMNSKQIYIEKNNLIEGYVYGGQGFKHVQLTIDLQVLTSDSQLSLTPIGSLKIGNDQYIFGDGYVFNAMTLFSENETAQFVRRNTAFNSFNEFGTNFEHHSIEFNPGANNDMFNSNSRFGYNVNDTFPTTIYFAENCILGKKMNAENAFSGLFYQDEDNFQFGPINSAYNDSINDKFMRGGYVTRDMIEDHVAIVNYGNPTYVPVYGILKWPAHGNPDLGEAENIAPFVDVNMNGIYEPLQGDYPKIYGDKCYLNIYHQNPNYEGNNDLEIHQYFYTYDCDTSEMLKNTVFVRQQFINRGGDLDSVYVGTFIDYDIGNYGDDRCGTDVENGMIYAYNGDQFDESDGSILGFQDSIPAQGMLVLKGVKKISDGLDNSYGVLDGSSINGVNFDDGEVDNEYYTLEFSNYFVNAMGIPLSDPINSNQLKEVLKGNWIDGTPKYYGGNGYSGTTNVESKYIFPGDSDPLGYGTGGIITNDTWSESTVGMPQGDRRMLASSGAGFLASGDTLDYLTAYIIAFSDDYDTDPFSLGKLKEYGSELKNAYASNMLGCGNTFNPIEENLESASIEENTIVVYPNPFSNVIYIAELADKNTITVYDINGRVVKQIEANDPTVTLELDCKSGVYFVEIVSTKNRITKKLIKH